MWGVFIHVLFGHTCACIHRYGCVHPPPQQPGCSGTGAGFAGGNVTATPGPGAGQTLSASPTQGGCICGYFTHPQPARLVKQPQGPRARQTPGLHHLPCVLDARSRPHLWARFTGVGFHLRVRITRVEAHLWMKLTTDEVCLWVRVGGVGPHLQLRVFGSLCAWLPNPGAGTCQGR